MSNNENKFDKEEFIKKKKKEYYLKKNLKKFHMIKTYKNKARKRGFAKRAAVDKIANIEQIYYYNIKRKDHSIYKIIDNMSKRILKELNKLGIERKFKYNKLFGCSAFDLKIHIENNFKEGMTWKNYGEWQVDHIVPVSSFNFLIDGNLQKCFNYKNLQPLWEKENREKWNKISEEYNNTTENI